MGRVFDGFFDEVKATLPTDNTMPINGQHRKRLPIEPPPESEFPAGNMDRVDRLQWEESH